MANAIVGVGEPTPSWRDERSTLALVVDAVRLALDDAPGVRLVARFADDLAVPAGTRVAARFGTDGDRPDLRFAADPGANEDRDAPRRTAS